MFPEIDAAMTRDELAAATRAVDSRLVALGGGAYAGLGFKLKALKAAGFDDRGPPVSPARLAAYARLARVLNTQGEAATMDSVIAALAA
ncbi:MAG: hypothetical protein JNK22_03270 [Rhodocyclaceae bacterium]|nr:hypothetical protein [Rhodocyclaceae bacterium]